MENIENILPNDFLNELKNCVGEEEYNKYLIAMNEPAVRGLRVNTNKISVDEFVKIFDYNLQKVCFSRDGFTLQSDEKLGNSFLHLAGAFYLQEPSSMMAVCASEIEKDNRPLKVLDLCASPGGKTGQIASRVNDDSIVFSNEIVRSRADVLYANVERLGYKNVIILNEDPKNLSCFENYYDYVFVDAPCSGEGMFRKNSETINEWSKENVVMCQKRQKEILDVATKLVKGGGKLVYSTCTFSKEEDEEIVEYIASKGNFVLKDVSDSIKSQTLPSLANVENGEYARKFLPSSGSGEGQFVAVFERTDETNEDFLHVKKHYKKINEIGRSNRLILDNFIHENMNISLNRRPFEIGNNIFLAPESFDGKLQTVLDEIRIISVGVLLGQVVKDRFEPNHALFMSYHEDFKTKIELSEDDAKRYLHGEEIVLSENYGKGYGVVTKNGLALGGVKIVGNRLKNLYPKGIRIWKILHL